jgi:hypothetical protein
MAEAEAGSLSRDGGGRALGPVLRLARVHPSREVSFRSDAGRGNLRFLNPRKRRENFGLTRNILHSRRLICSRSVNLFARQMVHLL